MSTQIENAAIAMFESFGGSSWDGCYDKRVYYNAAKAALQAAGVLTETDIPVEPGIYRDSEGDIWMLTPAGDWHLKRTFSDTFTETPQDSSEMAMYEPFTREV